MTENITMDYYDKLIKKFGQDVYKLAIGTAVIVLCIVLLMVWLTYREHVLDPKQPVALPAFLERMADKSRDSEKLDLELNILLKKKSKLQNDLKEIRHDMRQKMEKSRSANVWELDSVRKELAQMKAQFNVTVDELSVTNGQIAIVRAKQRAK